MKRISMIMALAFLVLAACKSPTEYPVDRWKDGKTGGKNKDTSTLAIQAIIGREWRLISFEEFGKAPDVVPTDRVFTLIFNQNGNAGGKADCNVYGVTYSSAKRGEVKFSDYLSTLAACSPYDMKYSSALIAAESYWTDGKTLLIEYDKGTKRLKYNLSVVTQGPDILAGSEWILTSFEEFGIGKENIPATEQYTIKFDGKGQASGTAACNLFNIYYKIGGDTINSTDRPIKMWDYVSTKIACPNNTYESRYSQALQNATKFFIYGDQLEISYQNPYGRPNATRMNFVRKINKPVFLDSLVNTKWVLISLDGDSTIAGMSSQRYTLNFDNANGVSGEINCNSYTAKYSEYFDPIDGFMKIKFSDFGSTDMLCPGGQNNAKLFEYLLTNSSHYSFGSHAAARTLVLSMTEDNRITWRYLEFVQIQ